jgi:hypothetical protein
VTVPRTGPELVDIPAHAEGGHKDWHRTRGYRVFPNARLYDRLVVYQLPDGAPWFVAVHAPP